MPDKGQLKPTWRPKLTPEGEELQKLLHWRWERRVENRAVHEPATIAQLAYIRSLHARKELVSLAFWCLALCDEVTRAVLAELDRAQRGAEDVDPLLFRVVSQDVSYSAFGRNWFYLTKADGMFIIERLKHRREFGKDIIKFIKQQEKCQGVNVGRECVCEPEGDSRCPHAISLDVSCTCGCLHCYVSESCKVYPWLSEDFDEMVKSTFDLLQLRGENAVH